MPWPLCKCHPVSVSWATPWSLPFKEHFIISKEGKLSVSEAPWEVQQRRSEAALSSFSSSISLSKNNVLPIHATHALPVSWGDNSHSRGAPAVLSPLCALRHSVDWKHLYHRQSDIKAAPEKRENISSSHVLAGREHQRKGQRMLYGGWCSL